MDIKHKFKAGEHLWYASQFCVVEVTVLALATFVDGSPSYIVEYQDPLPVQEEHLECYLFRTKLDALHDALRQNDISQGVVNNNIRNEVAFAEKLQTSSQRMRHLLYEEQIQEYMRNKNECLS